MAYVGWVDTHNLLYVRQHVPSTKKRAAITRLVTSIAKEAVRLHEAPATPEVLQRERFRSARREAEALEEQAEKAQEEKAAIRR